MRIEVGGKAEGYRVFYRQAGKGYDYSRPSWQGTATTCTFTLARGETWYFVARAYNQYGESPDSNEAVYSPASQ